MIIATLIFFLYRTDLWYPSLPFLLIGCIVQFIMHYYVHKYSKPIMFLFAPYVITYLLDIWALIASAIYSTSPTRLDIFPFFFPEGQYFGNGFVGMAVLGMMFLFLAAGSITWCLYRLILRIINSK